LDRPGSRGLLAQKGEDENAKKTEYESDVLGDLEMELSATISGYEQFLFYLAAVAGLQVFGLAVAGWQVLKGIGRYAHWKEPNWLTRRKQNTEKLQEIQYVEFLEDAARKQNRWQIFALGTLMSITAGGIAGWVYHFTLSLFESHPEIPRFFGLG